jgi:D-alanine-D-alanine ligase
MGGKSKEREVSLRSGAAVAQALTNAGYEVSVLDVNERSIAAILDLAPDVAFLALHGRYGEDGTIQGLLDILGIPYTGPGVLASAICINKAVTKKLLSYEGIPTSPFLIFDRAHFPELTVEEMARQVEEKLGIPVVVKPSTQGSSIGTTIVKNPQALREGLATALEFDTQLVVERFIPGVEVTASVLGNDDPVVLPLIEIVAENEFYDYEAKYTPGMSHHVLPARISEQARQRVEEIALRTYKAFDCQGLSRIDFIVDANDQPHVLEINTLPGMTSMSLFPDAARAAGMSFEQLCSRLVDLALSKRWAVV